MTSNVARVLPFHVLVDAGGTGHRGSGLRRVRELTAPLRLHPDGALRLHPDLRAVGLDRRR